MTICGLLFIFFAFVFISIWLYASLMRDNVLEFPVDSHFRHSFIVHGGGKLDGVLQSNSYESVVNAIALGCRFIELDLIETKDNKFVASHDWKRFRRDINFITQGTSEALSFSEISNSKLYGKYHILFIDDIIELMRLHQDLYIFTDITTNYKLINSIGFRDRLFVEAFNIFDYLLAMHHNIKRPMLNLNAGKLGIIIPLGSFLLTNAKHVTISMHTINRFPWFLSFLANRGAHIYIFTVNDKVLADKLIDEYRAVIYTDDLLEGCR